MKRADDFAERRKHIANLTDQELYDRFWALTEQVVAPLLELGRRNTTKLSREKNLSIPETGHLLAQGKYWDEAAALFKEGK